MTGLLQTNSCMAKVSVRVRRVWVRVRVSVSVRVRARVRVGVRRELGLQAGTQRRAVPPRRHVDLGVERMLRDLVVRARAHAEAQLGRLGDIGEM